MSKRILRENYEVLYPDRETWNIFWATRGSDFDNYTKLVGFGSRKKFEQMRKDSGLLLLTPLTKGQKKFIREALFRIREGIDEAYDNLKETSGQIKHDFDRTKKEQFWEDVRDFISKLDKKIQKAAKNKQVEFTYTFKGSMTVLQPFVDLLGTAVGDILHVDQNTVTLHLGVDLVVQLKNNMDGWSFWDYLVESYYIFTKPDLKQSDLLTRYAGNPFFRSQFLINLHQTNADLARQKDRGGRAIHHEELRDEEIVRRAAVANAAKMIRDRSEQHITVYADPRDMALLTDFLTHPSQIDDVLQHGEHYRPSLARMRMDETDAVLRNARARLQYRKNLFTMAIGMIPWWIRFPARMAKNIVMIPIYIIKIGLFLIRLVRRFLPVLMATVTVLGGAVGTVIADDGSTTTEKTSDPSFWQKYYNLTKATVAGWWNGSFEFLGITWQGSWFFIAAFVLLGVIIISTLLTRFPRLRRGIRNTVRTVVSPFRNHPRKALAGIGIVLGLVLVYVYFAEISNVFTKVSVSATWNKTLGFMESLESHLGTHGMVGLFSAIGLSAAYSYHSRNSRLYTIPRGIFGFGGALVALYYLFQIDPYAYLVVTNSMGDVIELIPSSPNQLGFTAGMIALTAAYFPFLKRFVKLRWMVFMPAALVFLAVYVPHITQIPYWGKLISGLSWLVGMVISQLFQVVDGFLNIVSYIPGLGFVSEYDTSTGVWNALSSLATQHTFLLALPILLILSVGSWERINKKNQSAKGDPKPVSPTQFTNHLVYLFFLINMVSIPFYIHWAVDGQNWIFLSIAATIMITYNMVGNLPKEPIRTAEAYDVGKNFTGPIIRYISLVVTAFSVPYILQMVVENWASQMGIVSIDAFGTHIAGATYLFIVGLGSYSSYKRHSPDEVDSGQLVGFSMAVLGFAAAAIGLQFFFAIQTAWMMGVVAVLFSPLPFWLPLIAEIWDDFHPGIHHVFWNDTMKKGREAEKMKVWDPRGKKKYEQYDRWDEDERFAIVPNKGRGWEGVGYVHIGGVSLRDFMVFVRRTLVMVFRLFPD